MTSRWSPRTWVPALTGQRYFPGLGVVHFDPRAAREAEFIFHEIFDHADYLPPDLELGPGSVVLDVGANIGLFTLYVALRLSGDVQVWAFEPVPQTHDYLGRNIAEHGLSDRVHAARLALGGAPGELELTYYPHLPGNSTADPAEKSAQFGRFLETLGSTRPWAARVLGPSLRQQMTTTEIVRCEVTTIGALAADHRWDHIDLLKVDVEGAELDVLRGVGPAVWPRVRRVVVETHERGDRLPALEALLREQGLEGSVERPRFTDALAADNRVIHARRA